MLNILALLFVLICIAVFMYRIIVKSDTNIEIIYTSCPQCFSLNPVDELFCRKCNYMRCEEEVNSNPN